MILVASPLRGASISGFMNCSNFYLSLNFYLRINLQTFAVVSSFLNSTLFPLDLENGSMKIYKFRSIDRSTLPNNI